MGRRADLGVGEMCEYRRCGGKGGREGARPWRACTHVHVGGRRMHVCESCASLVKRGSATRGGARGTQEGGPQQLVDIMREMSLPEAIPPGTPAVKRMRRNAPGSGRGSGAVREARPRRDERVEPSHVSTPSLQQARSDAPPSAQAALSPKPPVANANAATETEVRGIRRRPGGNREASVAVARSLSASLEQRVAPAVTSADESASPEQRLYALLKTQRCEIVDSRPKGGVLWVVGGQELEPTIREARKVGYAFTWTADGGKKTRGRAAWWCKRMRG